MPDWLYLESGEDLLGYLEEPNESDYEFYFKYEEDLEKFEEESSRYLGSKNDIFITMSGEGEPMRLDDLDPDEGN